MSYAVEEFDDYGGEYYEEAIFVPNPTSGRGHDKLRACMACRILLSYQQFIDRGCPNCPDLIPQCDSLAVDEQTTMKWEGVLTLLDPKTSWVARFIRLQGGRSVRAGCYAVKVMGNQMT